MQKMPLFITSIRHEIILISEGINKYRSLSLRIKWV